MDIILMNDSMLLAICCTFCSISIRILFHFLLLILSCSITIVRHLRHDYCENFELAWKETIDKLNEICLVFENIIEFLVNIGNHLVV